MSAVLLLAALALLLMLGYALVTLKGSDEQ